MPLPTLDDPERLEQPPDFDAVFGFQGPLELEIGSGKGGFAIGYAERYPARRLVAMEWRHKYAELTRRAAEHKGLANLLVLRADAKRFVPRLFAGEALDAVRLHFPDPWWKRRHFKRRVLDPPYAKQLFLLLKHGGRLDVRTDVEERALDMMEVLLASGFINTVEGTGFAPFDPEEVPSTRERRYLARAEPVWRIQLLRP